MHRSGSDESKRTRSDVVPISLIFPGTFLPIIDSPWENSGLHVEPRQGVVYGKWKGNADGNCNIGQNTGQLTKDQKRCEVQISHLSRVCHALPHSRAPGCQCNLNSNRLSMIRSVELVLRCVQSIIAVASNIRMN